MQKYQVSSANATFYRRTASYDAQKRRKYGKKKMRKTAKAIIGTIAVLLCLGTVSCKKDTTIQYDNMTMGNVTDGIFTSDQGNIFHVAEQHASCKGKLDTMKRAIIICDVLNRTEGGQSNEYDIRLNAMGSVKVKDILLPDAGTEEELVENPVNIENLWISGGYINMYISFPVKKGSKTVHKIDLVKMEAEKGYTFRLYHNAYDETLENGSASNYELAGGYISFPVNSLIKEDECNLKIEWTWYQSTGSGLSQATQLMYIEGRYKKDGYEHAPSKPSGKGKALIK